MKTLRLQCWMAFLVMGLGMAGCDSEEGTASEPVGEESSGEESSGEEGSGEEGSGEEGSGEEGSGEEGSGEEGSGEENPCDGLECGAFCTPECPEGEEDCLAEPVAYACNAEGECVVGEDLGCPDVPEECLPEDCGDQPDVAACPDGSAPDLTCSASADGSCAWEVGACESMDLCEDFLPPCSEDSECPESMFCSFEGCNPSNASCDPETGELVATEDCGGGKCVPVEDLCADLIPPCNSNADCPGDLVCEMAGCAPEILSCDPATGEITYGEGCGGGQCVPGCEPGSPVPAGDGCNSCTCPENGVPSEADQCTQKECETTCFSSEDCGPDGFCDFPYDDCGVNGFGGTCVAKPEICTEEFTDACGCDGMTYSNACSAQAAGQDIHQYGGCATQLGPDDHFVCGDTYCPSDEGCAISFNDVAGPDQPDYYSSCFPFSEGGVQGDCTTLLLDEWTVCFDGGEFTVVFYPGG